MCTLIVAWRVFADHPIAVAANRDEQFGRPSAGPARIGTDPDVVGPRDLEAGGTWICYNEAGLLAAVTNRWTDERLQGERSRGLLTLDALGARTTNDAVRIVERELVRRRYDAFNLLLCDAEDAVVLEWDGRLRVRTLDPGLNVVMNVGVDDSFDVPTDRRNAGERQVESARTLREVLAMDGDETAEAWLDRAGTALGDHEIGVCVHGDGFGTRSSSLVAVPESGMATYRYADGPPCRTSYVTVETQI